jgi:D-alanine-D-alanine ligase
MIRSYGDLPQKVAIIYSDVKRAYFPTEVSYMTEKLAYQEADIIGKIVERIGSKVYLVAGGPKLSHDLARIKPDLVINFVTSLYGCDYLAPAAIGVLEMMGVPYTGTGILGESLGYNKFLTKKLLEQNGIPVPRYQLFTKWTDPIDPHLRYPIITKLNEIHGGVEIDVHAVSENEKQLRQRLKFLITTYPDASVLAEEFIVGKEIDALIFEGSNTKVYLAESLIKKPLTKYVYKYFELQWDEEHYKENIQFVKYRDPILNEYAKKAFDILDMADYARFDVRQDASGRYYFIDANSNPQFGPAYDNSVVGIIFDLYGIDFTQVVKRLLINTIRNAKGKKKLPAIPH